MMRRTCATLPTCRLLSTACCFALVQHFTNAFSSSSSSSSSIHHAVANTIATTASNSNNEAVIGASSVILSLLSSLSTVLRLALLTLVSITCLAIQGKHCHAAVLKIACFALLIIQASIELVQAQQQQQHGFLSSSSTPSLLLLPFFTMSFSPVLVQYALISNNNNNNSSSSSSQFSFHKTLTYSVLIFLYFYTLLKMLTSTTATTIIAMPHEVIVMFVISLLYVYNNCGTIAAAETTTKPHSDTATTSTTTMTTTTTAAAIRNGVADKHAPSTSSAHVHFTSNGVDNVTTVPPSPTSSLFDDSRPHHQSTECLTAMSATSADQQAAVYDEKQPPRRNSFAQENYKALVENISEVIVKIDNTAEHEIHYMNRNFFEHQIETSFGIPFEKLFEYGNPLMLSSSCTSTCKSEDFFSDFSLNSNGNEKCIVMASTSGGCSDPQSIETSEQEKSPVSAPIPAFPENLSLSEYVKLFVTDLFETRRPKLFEWSRQVPSKKNKHEMTTRYLVTKITPVIKDDVIVAAIAIISDVTDRKKAVEMARSEEQAKIASKSKSEFIASMSHELRNPLHAILCTIQLLSATEKLTHTQMNYIEDLNENAKLLKATLSDILDMSKIESGTIELMETSESVLEIVETCADIFSSQAAAKGIELFTYVDTKIQTELLADKTRLLQILSNFTSNAIKFTKHGHIFLKAILLAETEIEQTVEFSCCDTGIGIKQEDTSKLFKPWIQVASDTPTTKSTFSVMNTRGYGLGLSLCEKLVNLMHGKIFVNTKYGEGSTFGITVTLKKNTLSCQENYAKWYTGSLYQIAVVMHENAQFNEVLTRYLNSINIHRIHYTTNVAQCAQIIHFYKQQQQLQMSSIVVIADEQFTNGSKTNSPTSEISSSYHSGFLNAESQAQNHSPNNSYNNSQMSNLFDAALNNGSIANSSNPILREANQYCKVISLVSKFNMADVNENADTFAVSLKKPLKFARLMNALSGRRNSVSSSLLWDANFSSKVNFAKNAMSNVDMLIVEDNPINQKVAMKLLYQLGVKSIDLASNGVEALTKIQSKDSPYSLILMDLQMPFMDGITCAKAIRSLPNSRKRCVPIVALTANAWQDSINECLRVGMNDVLTKPVTLENLMLKLQQHARMLEAEQQQPQKPLENTSTNATEFLHEGAHIEDVK